MTKEMTMEYPSNIKISSVENQASGRITGPLTDEIANKIEIFRYRDGGFQRDFRTGRTTEIAGSIQSGVFCPSISVADVNGRYLLIDGQHRLKAWQISKFPLEVTIAKMSEAMAKASFIAMNREQKKVSLQHILKVSDEDYAVRVRNLAGACGVTIPHVHNLMAGILNSGNPLKKEITPTHWKTAARVMTALMKDRRWGRENSVFSTCGSLKLFGFFAGKSEAVDSIIKDISKLDFSKDGKIGRMVGTSGACQKNLRNLVYKALAEKII